MSTSMLVNEKTTRSLTEFEFLHDPNDKNSKLGVGSFASVKLAREKKSGKLYAIKIISTNPSKVTSSDLHNIRTEIYIHRKLDHPNIIKFHDYMQKEYHVYFVLDYAENGNLYSYLHKKRSLTSEEIFRFFHQTCLAIQYLHQNDILHRDIKPENLLLDRNYNIKLCDFGWSTKRITEKRTTFCGTYEYMAPEIVYKKPYDYRVDIWSLGVLLYELIHKEAPYKGRSLETISRSLAKTSITFSPSTPPEAKDLILKILKTNPNERLSVGQILSHPWVRSQLPQETQSTQTFDANTSPRDMKLTTSTQAAFCDSPRIKLRRDKENLKSEIIRSGDNTLTEFSTYQTKKASNIYLFNSFNGTANLKDKEIFEKAREKEKGRENLTMRSIDGNPALYFEAQRRKPLQEFGANLQPKVANDNESSSSKGHAKSSSSSSTNILEKIIADEKKNPSSQLTRKNRIFENNLLLSPTLKTKVNTIITQLSSQTTTNKPRMDISIFSNRSIVQQSERNCSQPQTATSRYFNDHHSSTKELIHVMSRTKSDFKNDDSGKFSTSSSSLNTSKAKMDSDHSKSGSISNHAKSTFHVKLSLPKGDEVPPVSSPLSNATRTARSKAETGTPEQSEHVIQPLVLSPKFTLMGSIKSPFSRNIESVQINGDELRKKAKENPEKIFSFMNFYKGPEVKRKQISKIGEELSSANQNFFSLNETKNEQQREIRRDLIKDKENRSIAREDYGRSWAI